MKNTFYIILLFFLFAITTLQINAQSKELTMKSVVHHLSLHFPLAEIVKLTYQNELLEFHCYKMNYLPLIDSIASNFTVIDSIANNFTGSNFTVSDSTGSNSTASAFTASASNFNYSLSWNNIFNTDNYTSSYFDAINTFQRIYHIRPSNIMFKVRIKLK